MSTKSSQDPIETKKYDEKDFVLTHKTFPGCKHIFEIQPKREFLKSTYAEAVKAVNKEVSVPGFRKGKAPEAYIKSNFQKAIDSEWQDISINKAFSKAIAVAKVSPRDQKSVENVKVNALTLDGDSDLTVKFESFPTIPDFDVSAIKIETAPVQEVTEAEIEKALHNIRLSHATWEDLPEKAIAKDDWVVLDIDGTQEGETFEIGRSVKTQANKEGMNPWMVDLILGKKMGEVAEGMSQKDENAGDNYKPTLCKITVLKVQKPILPELNAEFAEKVRLPSIDDLKPRIKESIENNKKEEQKEKYHEAIVEQIQKNFVFDVPASFIESDVKAFVNEYIKRLRKDNLGEEELKTKAEAYEVEKRQEVEKAFRLHLIVQKFAAQHKIKVSEDEVVGEMISMIQRDPQYLQQMQSLDEEKMLRLKDRIHSEKTIEKALDHMLNQLI